MKCDIVYNSNEAIRLYNDGYSLRSVSEMFGVSRKFIRKSISSNRDIRSAASQLFVNAEMNTYMSKWFDDIDSHLKAYWLGFIFADGSVAKNKRQIEIGLAIKDVVHLERFAELFGIKVSDEPTRCRCRVCNVYLCNRLVNIGILPNKTYIDDVSILDHIPFKFINSFILGFMDGDGSIYKDKRRNNYIIVNFVGRKSILKCIKDILVNSLGVNDNKLLPQKNIFTVGWSGRQAQKVLEWLYKDSPVKLERKYNIYTNYVSKIKQGKNWVRSC